MVSADEEVGQGQGSSWTVAHVVGRTRPGAYKGPSARQRSAATILKFSISEPSAPHLHFALGL